MKKSIKSNDCPHEDSILYGKSMKINKQNRVVQVTCDTCKAHGTIYEQREKHSSDSDWYEVNEVWHEHKDYYGEQLQSVTERKPFNFVHDINMMYHKFRTTDWFYPATGYSEDFVKRNCYKLDGQVFYKAKKSH